MDKREAEFLTKLLATYKVESLEHLKNLSDGLLALEAHPTENKQKELLEVVFREAHSLKGASRAVNFQKVEKLCQEMENVLSAWKKGLLIPSPALFDTLYAVLDWLNLRIPQSDQTEAVQDLEQLNLLLQKLELLEPNPTTLSQANSTRVQEQSTHEPPASPQKSDESNLEKIDHTIRVSSHKLDHLLQQVEEMLVVKLTSAQRFNHFKEIALLMGQWDKEWNKAQINLRLVCSMPESSFPSSVLNSLHQLQDFLNWQQHFIKNFKETTYRYTRAAAQDHRIVTGLVDTLLDDTKKVLMQPFSTLLDVFPRMVRDISHSLGKKIHLQMSGGEIEIDRRILEELKDPLIHLIRNSIDHGIELPDERLLLHKPPDGTISMAASQISGNSVEISVSDDGKGINAEKVKQTAIKQNILTDKDAQRMSEEEILKLIFQSGISTSSSVTELSGRGLGMGIVSEKVEKLGGQVFIETKKDSGTTFRLVLPLTLATFRGIHITAAEQDFIIPTQNVKRILRLQTAQIKSVEGKETILYEGHTLAYIPLAQILQLPSMPNNTGIFPVMIIKAAETTLAVGVDQILNEQEVLIKGLGKQLARVRNIAAATVLESGHVIPILDPFDLVKTVVKGSRASILNVTKQQAESVEDLPKRKVILIAEDSVTARILLQNILESAGYEVKLAVDGVEAFTQLQTEKIDILLSDIEMPRMTGLELTAKVRATEKLKDLPVILCTSRGSKEDREQGIEVGANAYIDKNHFVHSSLLDTIQKLL